MTHISIVVPVYNASEHINHAIRSVLLGKLIKIGIWY